MSNSYQMSFEPTRDKLTLRKQLQAERLALADRHQRSVHLQEVLRVWLVSRSERIPNASLKQRGLREASHCLSGSENSASATAGDMERALPAALASLLAILDRSSETTVCNEGKR